MTEEQNNLLFPNEPQRLNEVEFNRLLFFCYENDTSDVTIQTNEAIVAEIHGRLHKITRRRLSNSEVGSLLNIMYGPNGTTQLLSGRDLDHYYEIKPNRATRIRFRLNATACLVEGHNAIQLTLRIIPSDPPSLEGMNLPDNIMNSLAPQQGVVYITGATGSGKSTLLASIIKYIAEDPEAHRKILTYESPIEFVYDNIDRKTSIISQSEIPLHLPSFAAGVRNALRRKPRLILVGESRDQETMSAVLEAALTGHPVYTTLHSNGVAESIRRLVGTFPKEERNGKTIDIIETIRLIIWQKLVPTVDGKVTPLREFLVFDDQIRDQLLGFEPIHVTSETRKLLEKHGQTMADDAKVKFDDGIISEQVYKKMVHHTKSLGKDAHVEPEK
jgi:defect in organelle trafficking protein DotB